MEKLISFWATPDWRLLGSIAVILLGLAVSIYWWCKVTAKNREKEQKRMAITLGIEHVDELFKIREIDEEKKVILLSPDPTMEHSSGTGNLLWVKKNKIPNELMFMGSVIKVIEAFPYDGEIEIIAIALHKLPTEKETLEWKEYKAFKLKEAAALELEQAKKAT